MMQLGRLVIVHQTGMFHDIMRISHAILPRENRSRILGHEDFFPKKTGLREIPYSEAIIFTVWMHQRSWVATMLIGIIIRLLIIISRKNKKRLSFIPP